MDILIKNARVITMDDKNPYLENAYVLIKGRKIEYVGKDRPGGVPKREIDARGNVVMPGLVNTHTHIPMTLFRGLSDDCELSEWLFEHIFPAEEKLTDEAVKAGTTLALAEMISFGTTSFSDSYFFMNPIATSVFESGLRANLSRSIAGNGEDFDNMPSVLEMREFIEKYDMADEGRIRADIAIHAEYTSEPLCRKKVAEVAKEKNLILQIHTSESESEHINCIEKYGKTPTALFESEGLFEGTRPLLAHCCYMTEEDMEILAANGGSVAHCPMSNLKLASGVAPVLKMLGKGLNVTLGTDGTASNNNTDMFEELKLFAVLHKGISRDPTAIDAMTALRTATVNGARAQGRDNTGVIKEGFEADLIMLDFNKPHLTPCHNVVSNVVYSAKGSDVCLTMVAGKILYENGEFKTIDIERAMRSVVV